MMRFDSVAAAVDWLDAYTGKSLDIVDMYESGAVIACGCGSKLVVGDTAIEANWVDRFSTKPALKLVDVQPTGQDAVLLSYRTTTDVEEAALGFDQITGKIVAPVRSCCSGAMMRDVSG